MGNKRHKPEEIVSTLRQVDMLRIFEGSPNCRFEAGICPRQ
jgi:hypothetical protein